MTEDEAKTKWCPFVRVNNGQGFIGNRDWEGRKDSAFNTRSRCIASACMAWRSVTRTVHRVDLSKPDDEPQPRTVVDGYCGLAGAPQ